MKRKAYIIASNEMVRPPLLFWLQDHGFNARDMVFIHDSRSVEQAKAQSIECAIVDKVDMAIFCENDALPTKAQTDVFFLENRYHIQCVRYETESNCAFHHPNAFHSLIWRASRESLLKIKEKAVKTGSKLCEFETDKLGTTAFNCSCQSIAKLARDCGLTTGWIGNAGHVPRNKPIVPRICVYGT